MKGLIIKDFALMLQRKRSFILILVAGLCMNISTDGSYAVFWLTMIGSMLAISTVAYDEFDNCYPFLMSLPISRKEYAIEKYVFGIISGAAGWVLAVIACFVTSLIKGTEINPAQDGISMAAMLLIPVVILAFNLPFTLKYGTEKGRIYMIVIWGVVSVGVMAGINELSPKTDLGFFLMNLNPAVIWIAALISVAVVAIISVKISISIMEKKEF